uniref:OSJNBa0060B20.3 protein n=1 Tax=Oryza sativa subsp. japonica TaxID=39947 RepID=Q7X8T3_ORYSJ|nr:OSJNBa0060B20.3 [Oryza sativa Japonica Group]CAD40082.1 OSJNBa0085C10.34 [Oryza sativa Japonica Group]
MSWQRVGALLLGGSVLPACPGCPGRRGIGSVLLFMARMGWELCHVFRPYTVVEQPINDFLRDDMLMTVRDSSREGLKIIERCHASPYGGHYGAFRTQVNIWQSGFFWPTMYGDSKEFVRRCTSCERQGGITAHDAMPLTYNLQVEIFDVWGIDFMGPFPKSRNCEYILVAVDYISKWVEAMSCSAADAKHGKKMFTEIIFPRFGTPRMVISDGGSHFIDKTFRDLLRDLGAKHNVATPYHP